VINYENTVLINYDFLKAKKNYFYLLNPLIDLFGAYFEIRSGNPTNGAEMTKIQNFAKTNSRFSVLIPFQ